MPFSKQRRHHVAEQMDADDADPSALRQALAFIRKVNRLLRYNAAVLQRIVPMLSSAEGPATVLDVATGSGDLLEAIVTRTPDSRSRWMLLGLDRHPLTITEAARLVPSARFVRGDALALPFADRSIDIVTCGLFLHHLTEDQAIAALREMARVARGAVVVADLLRRRRAYAWITLFTLLTRPMVKHDARASVAHAFTLQEAKRLFASAGLADARFEVTFGHRFIATWSQRREHLAAEPASSELKAS